MLGTRLVIYLSAILAMGLFCSVADAKLNKNQLMDRMEAQFGAAIASGDAAKAKAIWGNIDKKFDGMYDKLAARTVIFSGDSNRQNALNKLYADQYSKFEKIVVFLSSIDLGFRNPEPSNLTGSLSGKIRDDNRKGIAGAQVVVAGHEATTNAKGGFSLDKLPTGTFELYAFAPGHQRYKDPGYQISANRKIQLSLMLPAANYKPMIPKEAEAKMRAALSKINIPAQTKVIGTETIVGTLLDADTGAPIVKAQVMMVCQSAAKSTTSDTQGHFVLEGIPTEVCDFTVMQSNVTSFQDMLQKAKAGTDRAYGFSAKYNITAKADHRHENTWKIKAKGIDLGGTVTGVVLNSLDGKPVEGAEVTVVIQRVGVVINEGRTAKTDANGRFKIELVPAGKHDIEANKKIFKSTSQNIEVVKAKSVDVTLKLEPITVGTVTGVALNAMDQKPLAGVKISIGRKSATTDAQGHFKLADVDAGDMTVSGRKAVFKPTSQGMKVLAAKSVDVILKLEPITVGTVTGIALNASDQKPLAGVKVTVGTKSATTDAQGRFKLADINAGDVTIEGNKEIFKPTKQTVKVLPAKSVDVTLKLAPITVGTVTGIALNAADQKPLAGVKISVGTKSATTDAQGRFKLADVDAGDMTVSGSKAVFKPASQGMKVLAAKSVDVTLKLEPITVGTVMGVVLNAVDQKPLAGVKVMAGTKSATTDAQGRFKLEDVDAGDVMVSGSKEVFKPASQGVKVLAAKNVDVTLKLAPITVGTVMGVALNATDQKPLAGVKVTVGTKSATTDAQGRFKLADVDAGDVTVGGSKEVFKPASQGVKVLAAKNVDVTLKLAPITMGTVMGVALNAVDQKPLAGVKISVGTKNATTDEQGRFKLADVDAGDVSVEGSKEIFKPAKQAVKVLPAKSVDVTLKLEPITVGAVTGVAFNAVDQKPLAGVKISIGTKSATTDAQGRFKVADVDAGDATVSGSKAVFRSASQGVKVLAAKSVDVTLKLEPITTASVKGVVVDKKNKKPIAGVRVSVGGQAVESDANGVFSFESVQAGQVVLLAQHTKYKTNETPFKLKAGETHNQRIEMERRREDVLELETALKNKGTVDLYGIHFDSGKDQFKPSSLSTLHAVSEVIKHAPGKVFEVSGHTDSDGPNAYNQDLSERRARTVIKWLVNHGIKAQQLKARGYGETKSVVPNNTEAGKALNRRVQLRVIK